MTEQHQIGDLTLTYLPREKLILLSLADELRMSLTLEQAMELSIMLDIWTQDYRGSSRRRKAETAQRMQTD